MPKEELLQFEGLVTEILPDARYRIQLDNGHLLVAYTAGRMKKSRIKTLAGDRVTVELSPYDLEKGRLIFRHKDERAATAAAIAREPSSTHECSRTRAPAYYCTTRAAAARAQDTRTQPAGNGTATYAGPSPSS